MADSWLRGGAVLAAVAGLAGAAIGQDEQPEGEAPAEGAEAPAEEELGPPPGFWEGWTTSVELGLNGSTGNTERFNFRAGLNSERLTERMETRGGLAYTLGIEDGDTTENKFLAQVRNDWLVPSSPWRYFARGSAEFDEFQSYDWLLAANGGAGYEFIDNDEFLLLGRAGAGVSQKVGGDEVGDRFRVEALLGGDFEWQITDRQKLFITADYYPAINVWPKYRLTSQGGYEVLVDPEMDMSLRLGYDWAYDSSPGDENKRSDLNYFAVLVWTF